MASPEELKELIHKKGFLPALLAIAYKFTQRKELAEDVVQDSLEYVFGLPEEKVRDIKNLEAYIKTVVYHKATESFQKETIKYRNIDPEKFFSESGSATRPWIKADLGEVIKAVNTHRNQNDRTIFDLFCKDYEYEEIALMVDQSNGNVRKRIFEIRKWLRTFFK